MIGRIVYFAAGAALGGYVVYKLNRAARSWSPEGIAHRVEDRVADYRSALREFNEDVAAAVQQREAELRNRHEPASARPALTPKFPNGTSPNGLPEPPEHYRRR
ncbi:DUF6167 family protein [Salinactinospora qingdaonensis]|uniref:Secreted protein n=1 Tax=Salinactinospora qingdaonensis TaxID=702744 RepID=A0ABP7FUD8_9ACTN